MCQAFSEVRFPPFPAARSVISLRPGCLAIAHRRPTRTIWLGTYGEIVAVRTLWSSRSATFYPLRLLRRRNVELRLRRYRFHTASASQGRLCFLNKWPLRSGCTAATHDRPGRIRATHN